MLTVTFEGMVLEPPEPLHDETGKQTDCMVKVWSANEPVIGITPESVKGGPVWLMPTSAGINAELSQLRPGDRVSAVGKMLLYSARPGHIEVKVSRVVAVSTLGRLQFDDDSQAT